METHKSVKLYCDGGGTNGTNSGQGVPFYFSFRLIDNGHTIVWEKRVPLEIGAFNVHCDLSNNVAEYVAMNTGIARTIQEGYTHFQVFSDSQLVVNQVNGKWAIKAQHLRPFAAAIQDQLKDREIQINWVRRTVMVEKLGH